MNWIATNIRFPREQYMQLKMKAAEERKSVAAVIREAANKVIKIEESTEEKQKKANKLLKEFQRLAEENSKHVPKDFNWVKALREIRYREE